jgi:DUF1009 family protein
MAIDVHDRVGPLAIVAGAGSFPLAVADAVVAGGREVYVVALAGISDPDIGRFPHCWIGLGQFGHFLSNVTREGCREVVFVGAVTRPQDWRDLAPDVGLLRRLPRVIKLFRGGDNHLLSGVLRLTEEAGLRVRGVHEVAPRVLLPEGPLGAREPDAEAEADIMLALDLLRALSPFDVGQGAVVAHGRVLAVEAADGTDGMLAHVAGLRRSGRLKLRGRQGVLVKAPKRGQDMRVDLPAFGPSTVAGAQAAGLRGIAGPAGRALVVDGDKLAAAADAAELFVIGLVTDGSL